MSVSNSETSDCTLDYLESRMGFAGRRHLRGSWASTAENSESMTGWPANNLVKWGCNSETSGYSWVMWDCSLEM